MRSRPLFKVVSFEETPGDLLDRAGVIAYAMNLVRFVSAPEQLADVIARDCFDNIFLGLAVSHAARMIISGDQHLIEQRQYEEIPIVTPGEAVAVIRRLR